LKEGPVIGYSEDGLVIFTEETIFQGKPAQIVLQWTVDRARDVARAILGAAGEAEKKRYERNGADTH
jgi:hypothetical protein